MSENDKKTDHGFVKSTADYPNPETPKAKHGFFKTIGVPFVYYLRLKKEAFARKA